MGIRDLSPSTVYNYESDFKQWMIYVLDNQGNAPVTELEEEDIEEFLFYCKKHGNNSARMKRRMSTISALYRYLRKKKIIKVRIRRSKTSHSLHLKSQIDPLQTESLSYPF